MKYAHRKQRAVDLAIADLFVTRTNSRYCALGTVVKDERSWVILRQLPTRRGQSPRVSEAAACSNDSEKRASFVRCMQIRELGMKQTSKPSKYPNEHVLSVCAQASGFPTIISANMPRVHPPGNLIANDEYIPFLNLIKESLQAAAKPPPSCRRKKFRNGLGPPWGLRPSGA